MLGKLEFESDVHLPESQYLTEQRRNYGAHHFDVDIFPVGTNFGLEATSLGKGNARPFGTGADMFREAGSMAVKLGKEGL